MDQGKAGEFHALKAWLSSLSIIGYYEQRSYLMETWPRNLYAAMSVQLIFSFTINIINSKFNLILFKFSNLNI